MKGRTTDVRKFFVDLVEFPSLCGAFQWSKQFFISKLSLAVLGPAFKDELDAEPFNPMGFVILQVCIMNRLG